MATAQNLIYRAYRKIGLKSPTDDEDDEALESVNDMISLWGTDFLVPYRVRESFTLTIGTRNYTFGSGGAFDTVRPMKLDTITLRNSDDYDWPITLMSPGEWQDIYYKNNSGRPTRAYYKPEYPLGILRLNKKPDEAYTLLFCSWKNFTEFAALSTTVALPNEYKDAVVYNLAVRLAEDNSVNIPASIIKTAAISLAVISRLSAINRIIPPAKFDFDSGSNLYNIVIDE